MAEKGPGKKKKGKGDANVLASLPTTRPNKLGRHSRSGPGAAKPKAKPARKKATKPKAQAAAAAAKLAAPKARPAAPEPAAKAVTPRPKPVRSASKNLAKPAAQSAGKRAPAPDEKPPSGTELVTTVVQAAGELASVGLSIGGQIVKRAVDRLPKP